MEDFTGFTTQKGLVVGDQREEYCPREHVIRYVDSVEDGGKVFVMECDREEYARFTFYPYMPIRNVEDWQVIASKDHLISYLRNQLRIARYLLSVAEEEREAMNGD